MAVQATVQETWRAVLARIFSRDLSSEVHQEIARFKIGEGGFTGSPREPKDPDASFTDLESEGTPLASGGTAAFTNGSVTVTGTGTSFDVDLSPGDWIKPGPDFSTPPGDEFGSAGDPGSEVDEWGEVQSVDSPTQVTLVNPYAGSTISGREVRKASEPLFTFRKNLADGDVLFSSSSPAITEITAVVDTGEANNDQLGNDPEFFELGLFDENGVMLVYVTFDAETKNSGIQLNHVIELIF